ncbi:hypothetical protein FSO04_37295 [Paraburkholderia madseniana]|uniref:Uncharacterized protein n=2 Tax=Paraburkholderia madseniana TaxID=2599607 RepID=A0A6N6W367_9BURK|nr:hypothetical protein FSO04_37295 [Paraburkholderia madseniana]
MIRDVQLNANPFSAQVLEVAAGAASGDAAGGRQLAFRTNPDAAPLRPSTHHEHWGEVFHHHGAQFAAAVRQQPKPQQPKRRAKPGGAGHGTESMHDPAEALLHGEEEEDGVAARAHALPTHAHGGQHVERVADRHHASRADTHTSLEEGDLTITGVQRRLEADDAHAADPYAVGETGLPSLAHAEVVALAHNIHRDAIMATGLLAGRKPDGAGGAANTVAQGLLEHAQRFLALLDPRASQLRFAANDTDPAAAAPVSSGPALAARTHKPGAVGRRPATRQARSPRPAAHPAFGAAGLAGVARAPLQATGGEDLFDPNLRILLRRSNTRYDRLLPRVVRLLDGTGSMGGFVMRDGRAMEWFRGAGLGMASSTNPVFL